MNFLEAFKQKYAPLEDAQKNPAEIRISGKVVEEIGFEKIQSKLAALRDLKIVVLDGRCITGVHLEPYGDTKAAAWQEWKSFAEGGLEVEELDISYNLFEYWEYILGIISCMPGLKVLNVGYETFLAMIGLDLQRCSGNRFSIRSNLPARLDQNDFPNLLHLQSLSTVTTLNLDNTLLSWDTVCVIHSLFNILLTAPDHQTCRPTPISQTPLFISQPTTVPAHLTSSHAESPHPRPLFQ